MEYRFIASEHTADQLEGLFSRDRELWLASFNYDIHLSPWAHKLVSWVMRDRQADMPLMPSLDDRTLKSVVDRLFKLDMTTTDTEVRQLHADLLAILDSEWCQRQESSATTKFDGSGASYTIDTLPNSRYEASASG